ncbi:MAG: hypothetical protein AcusKO_02980 [Acuticoccus sp.]
MMFEARTFREVERAGRKFDHPSESPLGRTERLVGKFGVRPIEKASDHLHEPAPA